MNQAKQTFMPPPTNRGKRSFMPRISLSTLMLLVVVLVIGLSSWQVEVSIEKAKTEVYPLRFLANELRIKMSDEYVVVGHFPTRMNELIYSVHIPDHGAHELCLALDGIPESGIVEAVQVVPLSSGVHQIELKLDGIKPGSAVHVLLDDQEVMSASGPASWKGRYGSEGGLQYRSSTHLPAEYPFTLVRQRFGPDYKQEVCPGVLLWIQPK